jgi:uncharacterized protein (TIGR01777 family)
MSRVVAITGASGLVGGALSRALTGAGWTVLPLVRRHPRPGEARWDPDTGRVDTASLEGIGAVVHLAGASIGVRWTPARKRRIRHSRVDGTRVLAEALASLRQPPPVLVGASGVGLYGDRGDDVVSEADPPGAGFLADLGQEWEAAADPARRAGIRVAHARLGIVLSPDGGALQRMLLPFRLGLGGRMGSGRQWMSWITLDDAVAAFRFLVERDDQAGPFNAVAPHPVRNADFARALGAALGRPAIVPVPGFLLELLFGEMAREALLAGQRAVPARLSDAGFAFRDPDLLPALRRLLS